jgi:polyisoprenyl-phosphate glycosyltransferase
MKISFVLPIYNEQENIEMLSSELEKLRSSISKRYLEDKPVFEFIYVNDGSKDSSLLKLKELYEKDIKQGRNEIKVLSFGRNSGHQIAVTAGQANATGDIIIIMDTDLQDPPMVCLDLIDKWKEGFDIVYAQRRIYKVPLTKKIPAWIFYRIIKKIASIDIPEDTGDFRLLSKRVNDAMNNYPEKNRYLRGISFLTGYKSVAVLFDRAERFAGKPMYTFKKSMQLALDGITSFSLFPIKMVTYCGFWFSFLSVFFGIAYISYSLFRGSAVQGWISLMLVVTFIGGVQMLMLGIIGEYIGRIFTEVIDRPLYTITECYGMDQK